MQLNRREANALRRLLNRTDFKARDVAQLGITRLESAQGLGAKGLAHVLAWLDAEGYCLRPQMVAQGHEASRQERINRRLEQAQHLLEQWGWQVKRPAPDIAPRD